MHPDRTPESIVTFHRVYPGAIPVMPADRSALGTVPAAGHQYCEALCTASAFGWYVFPPVDFHLKWNGADVFYAIDGDWEVLSSIHLPDFADHWDSHCPEHFKGKAPPFLSSLFVPGIVQIWSGMLVGTAADWSLSIRPPANVPQSRLYSGYEAIVETDRLKPLPLFTNIRLIATDIDIEFSRHKPLFQVQPIHRKCYAEGQKHYADLEGFDFDWEGYGKTIRGMDPAVDPHSVGEYGARTRKRGKRES